MAKSTDLPWSSLPTSARRKVRALLAEQSEQHPQGHYGAAVRAAMARLPEVPQSKLPPRSTPAGKELSAMLTVKATREQAFLRIENAVKLKGSVLQGAAHLGVHKRTLFAYMTTWPELAKRVRAANKATAHRGRGRTVKPPASARRTSRRRARREDDR